MSVQETDGLVFLPFSERQRYGDAHPIGIAVGHMDMVGDASGGVVSASLLADAGFLFRLELIQATRNVTTAAPMDLIVSHRWATDRSGLGATAFDMNWILEQRSTATFTFSTFSPSPADLQMIRRFPLGRTDNTTLQFVVSFNVANVDTVIHDFDVVLSYWRAEALFRPGFLASFWESPFVPTPAP